jgi:hypothetical protein
MQFLMRNGLVVGGCPYTVCVMLTAISNVLCKGTRQIYNCLTFDKHECGSARCSYNMNDTFRSCERERRDYTSIYTNTVFAITSTTKYKVNSSRRVSYCCIKSSFNLQPSTFQNNAAHLAGTIRLRGSKHES